MTVRSKGVRMFSEIKSAGLFGLNAFMVTVQASIEIGRAHV